MAHDDNENNDSKNSHNQVQYLIVILNEIYFHSFCFHLVS